MSKNGFRAFGLCLLAVLGLMAFSASAQATPAWMVEGADIAGEVGIQAEGLEGEHGQLLAKVGETPIEILCTNMEFEEGVLKTEGKSLGFIKFSGCQFKANGERLAVCDPTGGAILTRRLKAVIDLHPAISKEETYDELVPEEGETFVVVHTSEECSFGEGEIPVTGKITLKDSQSKFRVEKTSHLLEEFAPLTELHILETGEATLDGSANVELAGAGAGKKWSALSEPTPPKWMIDGANLIAGDAEIQSEGLEENDGQLLTTTASISFAILCTDLELEESVLKPDGTSLGFIKFTGCDVKINGSHFAGCDPPGGTILTKELKSRIILEPLVNGAEGYEEVAPEEGEALAIIELGEECAFGGYEVAGKVILQDHGEEGEVEKTSHLLEALVPLTELFYFGASSTLDGSSNVHLAGADTGKTWSSLPA